MPDLQPYYVWIFSGVAAFVLLIAVIVLIRMISGGVKGRRGSRLGIIEYHDIDKSRRLVLLRRDDIEHLVLIGGSQDLIIENKIETGLSMARKSDETASNIEPVLVMRPAPRPAVFGGRRPNLRPVESNIDNGDDNQPA